MIDREYFTLVFKGDIGKFELNPLQMETPFGIAVAAGRGDAFAECDELREALALSHADSHGIEKTEGGA